jgi:hypothetical protein
MTSKAQLASKVRLDVLIWFLIAVWVCLLLVLDVPIPEGFTKPASMVLLLLTLLPFVFNHWAWRWKWVNWIAQRPDLVGTWKGTLKSNYVDPDSGKVTPARDVFLIVHQTNENLHLRLLTSESFSTTLAASLGDEADGRHTISAVYRNEPKIEVRERSPIHRGGLHLRIGGQGRTRLEGDYWTDRGTNGSLDLTLVSKTEASDYEAALELAGNTETESLPK